MSRFWRCKVRWRHLLGLLVFAVLLGLVGPSALNAWLSTAPAAAQPAGWSAHLQALPVESATAAGQSYASSSKLAVRWGQPGEAVDHLELTADDGATRSSLSLAADAGFAILSDLKSSTAYTFRVRSCLDAACNRALEGGTATGTTAEEVWQLQGTGHTYETATQVVAGGNNIPYVIQYGAEAGPDLDGTRQLYYHPFPQSGVAIGIAISVPAGAELEYLSHFVPTSGGLRQVCRLSPNSVSCPEPRGALFINTFQAVPLAEGGRVRLYFEATDLSDPRKTTRLYSLDSQDGYRGQDFNSNPDSAVCGGLGAQDYAPGGSCDPTVVLGVEGDVAAGNTGLLQARQSKVGYPTRDSWLWDGAPGAFMVITGADACGQTQDGLFYATWGGARWSVVQETQGCARPLVQKAHGPVIVHLGGGRYKLYYEDASRGRQDKPFHLIYADATLTGDPNAVELSDWEEPTRAREVHFLWPDGRPLDEAEESGLGDHMILQPTDDPGSQVMYVNLGGPDNSEQPQASAGIGIAVLINP